MVQPCGAASWFARSVNVIIELRTYRIKPGRRAEFLEIFRTKSVPAHAEIGMKILGPLLSVEDPDVFFFMRGFPNLESREPMKAKFYDGELEAGAGASADAATREIRRGVG